MKLLILHWLSDRGYYISGDAYGLYNSGSLCFNRARDDRWLSGGCVVVFLKFPDSSTPMEHNPETRSVLIVKSQGSVIPTCVVAVNLLFRIPYNFQVLVDL